MPEGKEKERIAESRQVNTLGNDTQGKLRGGLR